MPKMCWVLYKFFKQVVDDLPFKFGVYKFGEKKFGE